MAARRGRLPLLGLATRRPGAGRWSARGLDGALPLQYRPRQVGSLSRLPEATSGPRSGVWRFQRRTPSELVALDLRQAVRPDQRRLRRRAVLRRPPSFWHRRALVVSERRSFELLPGTRFISRRVDLSPAYGFNKGVCIWFEHMWHLLFEERFLPDATSGRPIDLRAFTRLGDATLPLGLRIGGSLPDSVMQRHYWLSAREQCDIFRDEQGCSLAKLEAQGGYWRPEDIET
mmetsp:Transcript_47235/g.151609  ORF Transcript_47235/g.151609 Transcript_47235/m.151609 type:complete len:231 (-) Transcript_47235:61-753(-)